MNGSLRRAVRVSADSGPSRGSALRVVDVDRILAVSEARAHGAGPIALGGSRWHPVRMRFSIEMDREDDGRWIAEIPAIPSAMAYGSSADDAKKAVTVLALRILADRIEHGDSVPRAVLDAFSSTE